MNRIRRYVRDIFGFSRTEINGFLILLPLMAAIVLSEPVYRALIARRPLSFAKDLEDLDSLLATAPRPPRRPPTREKHVMRFAFNPNIAGIGEFDSLGIPRNLAIRIAAYRSKGGIFRIKSDLLKIYGFDSALYQQLYPYITLPATRRRGQTEKRRGRTGLKFEAGNRQPVDHNDTFDINTADTIRLKSVYGIGSTLAARIIKFREALGGFVRPEQLNEVYGLDSLVVRRLLKVAFIRPGFVPSQININIADVKQLSAHPYIRYKIARALVTFRYQHGDFADVSDIKKLSIVSDEEATRLLPYLKVRD